MTLNFWKVTSEEKSDFQPIKMTLSDMILLAVKTKIELRSNELGSSKMEQSIMVQANHNFDTVLRVCLIGNSKPTKFWKR